jgi:hypothetical protein
MLLLLLTGGAAGSRPTLPPTFVPIELAKFPTTNGCCDEALRTVTVGPTGQYQSIFAAVLAAPPRTKIVIAAGRYTTTDNEYLYYSAALSVVADDICIVGAGASNTQLVAAPGQKYGMLVSGQRTTISGLSLIGFQAAIPISPADTADKRTTLWKVRWRGCVSGGCRLGTGANVGCTHNEHDHQPGSRNRHAAVSLFSNNRRHCLP